MGNSGGVSSQRERVRSATRITFIRTNRHVRLVARFIALTFLFILVSMSTFAGNNRGKNTMPSGPAQLTTFTSKALQGFNMRVWLSNKLVMGIQAWDVGAASQIPLPPQVGLEYPAGSGVEHLFGGGPLIAGIINGKRIVDESYSGSVTEFIPSYEHISRFHFWKTETGIPPHDPNGWSGYYYNHGIVTNTRGCDDDHDGKVDEDDLDGLDNDGDWNAATDDIGADGLPDSLEVSCDGIPYDRISNPDPAQDNYAPSDTDKCHPKPDGTYPLKNNPDIWTEHNGIADHGEPHVDEDYGAVSENDLYCTTTDEYDFPADPSHFPMGIKVIQKSYAWNGDYADGILPFDYYFINIGQNTIRDVYIGFIMDCDVGPVSDPNYPANNYACILDTLRTAYVHNPVDPGSTPLGLTLLGASRPIDSLASLFRWFKSAGEIPTDDSTLFDYITGAAFPNPQPCQSTSDLSDTRFLYTVGPFETMNPGDTIKFSVALVSGFGIVENSKSLKARAERALELYNRGYHPPPQIPSPSLKITQEPNAIRLDWGASAGAIDPSLTWDDYNLLAHSPRDTSWNSAHPPCGITVPGGCAIHQCTYDSGKPTLPGGRVFLGYNLYRSEDPSLQDPSPASFYLLKQFLAPGAPYKPAYPTSFATSFVDSNVHRDKQYWYAVTSVGLPDIAVIPIHVSGGQTVYDTVYTPLAESPVTENARPVNLKFSASSKLDQVLVVPNPYRADADYTTEHGGWEGNAYNWNDTKRLIKFIHLPRTCTVRIFTLSGELITTLHYQAPSSTPNAGELAWGLRSDNGSALASGLYIFTVESEFGTQTGKFVVIR